MGCTDCPPSGARALARIAKRRSQLLLSHGSRALGRAHPQDRIEARLKRPATTAVSCDSLSPGAPSNGGFRHSRNFRYPSTLAASGPNGSGGFRPFRPFRRSFSPPSRHLRPRRCGVDTFSEVTLQWGFRSSRSIRYPFVGRTRLECAIVGTAICARCRRHWRCLCAAVAGLACGTAYAAAHGVNLSRAESHEIGLSLAKVKM